MIADIPYPKEGFIEIAATIVGISKYRWIAAAKETSIEDENIKQIMKNNRFDVLPIGKGRGLISEHYKTVQNGDFSKIERKTIDLADCIPQKITIREVIRKFATDENRMFFFLTYEHQISGMITISNLNARQVQIYIFSLICEMERRLSDFLIAHTEGEQEIIDLVNQKATHSEITEEQNQYDKILTEYKASKNEGYDNHITSFLYFSNFLDFLRGKELHKLLGYSSKKWKDLNSLNNLRNMVAHPTQPLLSEKHNIVRLNNRLERIEKLLFRLRQHQS